MPTPLPECTGLASWCTSERALLGRLEILKEENIRLRATNSDLSRGTLRNERDRDDQQVRNI